MPVPQSEDEVDAVIEELCNCVDDGDFDNSMRCLADLTTYFALFDLCFRSRFMPSRKLGARKYSAQPLLRASQRPSSLGPVKRAQG